MEGVAPAFSASNYPVLVPKTSGATCPLKPIIILTTDFIPRTETAPE